MEYQEIYLAGGCFWGLSHLFSQIKGVAKAICGYANGKSINPSYKEVCSGQTEALECVKVIYDANLVSLENLLFHYFAVVDPNLKNQQGNDIGKQYQTGIFYLKDDLNTKNIVDKIYALEKNNSPLFYIEKSPLLNFFEAEEYHQDYLFKNPNGYCHIPLGLINRLKDINIKPYEYTIKAKELLKLKDGSIK